MSLIYRMSKHLAVGFVLLSALILGYILYELDNTIEYLGEKFVEHASARIHSELEEFFLPGKYLLYSFKYQQDYYFFNKLSQQKLNQFFVPIIDQFPQISSIGIADDRGYEINILPDSTKKFWLNREVNVDEWGMVEKWSSWDPEKRFKQTKSWEKELEIDPRNRLWYKGAMQEAGNRIYWTAPYRFQTNNEIGFSASIKWASVGNRNSIITLDLSTDDISQFMQHLKITENNRIFILYEDRNSNNLSQEHTDLNSDSIKNQLLFTPSNTNYQQLITLFKIPTDEIVTFENEGEKWWAMVDKYPINKTKRLLIAVMIPESDFSGEIDAMKGLMIAGFLGIIILSSLLVWNHNRLQNAKTSLKEKNEIINMQNERLFSEVHHRVKNNLAIMSALMELENMDSNNQAVKEMLTQTQRRIRSMAAVHEVMYKSDDVNKIEINEFIPAILNLSQNDFNQNEIKYVQSNNDIHINVNQALTYALLLNEYISGILKSQLNLIEPIKVELLKQGDTLITKIIIGTKADELDIQTGVGTQLIQVLAAQLKADMRTKKYKNQRICNISFELREVKGIASSFS